MTLLTRIFLLGFGVFLAAAAGLLTWRVGRAWWGRRFSADEWLLAAVAVATCGAYGVELVRGGGAEMPRIGPVWVVVFGLSCAVHVVTKAVGAWMKR